MSDEEPIRIPLRAKYRYASHGKFKAHYDHQGGVTFTDEQGKRHQVPNKKHKGVISDQRISDLKRS